MGNFKLYALKTVCIFCFFVIHLANSFLPNNFRIRRETTSNGCVLPPHPKFGQWLIFKSTSSLLPGQVTSTGTILLVSCQNNYKLERNVTACINGRWTPEIDQCLKKCPPLLSTAARQVTCTNGNKKANCIEAVDGIKAQFQCANFYENSRNLPYSRDHSTCMDGRWSEEIPECVPVCGHKIVADAPTLIVNGSDASENSYPWQVAIYNTSRNTFLCGGSLINQRVILTAAHCVTDQFGNLLPKDNYIVTVGNYYRNFKDHRDINRTQSSSLQNIFIPEQYQGHLQNYLGDVALLVTNEILTYSHWVQPVCVDWNFKYQNAIFNYTKQQIFGYISGWGYTSETGKLADALRELKVPLVIRKECSENLPADNEQYLTHDKLCAGYLNSNASACNGDSGGGLVFEYKERHYLAGIVSISPREYSYSKLGCDSRQYTLYTNISHYIEAFISPTEARIRALISCEQDPGCKDVIPVLTTEQPPDLANREHVNFKTCPPLFSTASRTVTCSYRDSEMSNCTEPVDGTEARFKCAPSYEFLGVQRNPVHICVNDKWYPTEPTCVPVCGKWKVDACGNEPTASEGSTPWQVAIFRGGDNLMACAGTLINARAVFTAAECVTDADIKPYPKDDFKLAVGKYKPLLHGSQDSKEVQVSTVYAIFIHPQFKGPSNSFAANIALVIANTTFTLSLTVQPVCVDFNRKYAQDNDMKRSGFTVGSCCSKKTKTISDSFKNILVRLSPAVMILYHRSSPLEFYVDNRFNALNLNNDTNICEGHYGGGLVFNHDGRYYLKGIRSVELLSYNLIKHCPSKPFSSFTRVYDYMDYFMYDQILNPILFN